jgi:hypothetical protein
MLHLLLIILLVVVIWKVAGTSGHSNPLAIQTGLARLRVVLSVIGAFLGGLIGYAASNGAGGAILLGTLIGAIIVWAAMGVVIWIINGFLAR